MLSKEEIEEARNNLKYKIENNLVISRHNSKDYESIETVLEALKNYKRRYEMAMEQNVKDYENSIPKKKIVNILNECKPNSTNTFIESQEKYIKLYESIKELLEG